MLDVDTRKISLRVRSVLVSPVQAASVAFVSALPVKFRPAGEALAQKPSGGEIKRFNLLYNSNFLANEQQGVKFSDLF